MARFIARNEGFTCGRCGQQVAPIKYGGSYRNHCPYCLWSKHADTDVPGDRESRCMGLMSPIGLMTRRTGEFVLVHRCTKCHFERYNRVASDDNAELLTKLSGGPVK